MDKEKPVEYYESKVLAAADKWFDAKYKKVGVLKDCEKLLSGAVTKLTQRRAEAAMTAPTQPRYQPPRQQV